MSMEKDVFPVGLMEAMKSIVEDGEEAILKKEHGKYVVVAAKRKVAWTEKDNMRVR